MSIASESRTYGGYYGPLKVYGWVDHNHAALVREWPNEDWHHYQVRSIVAARSKAEAARCAGYDRPSQMWNLGETRNVIEGGVALNDPGVVFFSPLDRKQFRPLRSQKKP